MLNKFAGVATHIYNLCQGKPVNATAYNQIHNFFADVTSLQQSTQESPPTYDWDIFFTAPYIAQYAMDNWPDAPSPNTDISEKQAEDFLFGMFKQFQRYFQTQDFFCGETITKAHGLMDFSTEHFETVRHWTLHISTEGKCLFNSDKPRLIDQHNIVLIGPQLKCKYQRAPNSKIWRHYWIQFTPEPEWLKWSPALRAPSQLFIGHIEPPRMEGTHHAIKEIIDLRNDTSTTAKHLTKNRLEYLLTVANQADEASHTVINKRIKLITDYLTDNFRMNCNVETLAQICNLSKSRMSALFKQEMGVSPLNWRDQLRMRQARKLLNEGNLSTSCIAASVGYDDPLHFSRRFSQVVGVSPRQYRTNQ